MQDDPGRRTRVRPARRRSTPIQTPARPQRDPGWWRRIPWVHIGAVLGALAAVGGLVLTGIATYWGTATARDQLDQSRKEALDESRKQAERIWSWGQWHGSFCVPSDEEDSPADKPSATPCDDRRIEVANRSADPVYGVWVRFWVDQDRPDDDVYLKTGDMGPCTEVAYRPGDLYRDAPHRTGPHERWRRQRDHHGTPPEGRGAPGRCLQV